MGGKVKWPYNKSRLEDSLIGHPHDQRVCGFFKKGYLNSKSISCFHLGEYFQVDGKQYKELISDYKDREQKDHVADWMVFPENMGKHLTINEPSLPNGEFTP